MSDERDTSPTPTPEDGNGGLPAVLDEFISTLRAPMLVTRNLTKAFNRLVSSSVNIPVAYLDGIVEEKRAITEARVNIIRTTENQIIEGMHVPREYAHQAGVKYAEKIVRGQKNLDKTFAVAMEELQQSGSTSSGKQGTDSGKDEQISDDFLNKFDEIVRQKSSEEMQHYFGLILAGEIRKPETFSIRTLTILSEIDQYTAALFKRLCSLSLAIKVDDRKFLDVRVCSLDGHAGYNSLSKYGLGYDELTILHEYGLITSDYDCRFPYITSGGSSLPFEYQGRTLILQPSNDEMKGKEYKVAGVALSIAGRELYAIVDQDTVEVYTQELKNFFVKQGLKLRIVRR